VTAAATTFINLVLKESDNNVKLIVLDRLDTLRSKHGHMFDNLIMDVLQVLSRYIRVSAVISTDSHSCSADIEVRRKATSIALSMTSSRNVEDVVSFFKKQLQRTQDQDYEKVLRSQLDPSPCMALILCRLRSIVSC
jgi:coatomer subunit beta